MREDVGTISQTDYGYTSQSNLDSGIGLMDCKARFYSPYINRFVQPDTLVPYPSNPQSLNRFSYVHNNPINFMDPTGHWECNLEPEECGYLQNNNPGGGMPITLGNGGGNGGCPVNNPNCVLNPDRDVETNTDTDNDGFPNAPDPYADPVPLGTHSDPNCNVDEIVECFYSRGRLPTGEHTLSDEQLENIMLAVYLDITNRHFSYSDWRDREIYDTPFWDGYKQDSGIICVNDNCYDRNEVNYFAQGMYSAKYEGKTLGEGIAQIWKYKEYTHWASAGTISWFEKGYDFYMENLTCSYCGVPTK